MRITYMYIESIMLIGMLTGFVALFNILASTQGALNLILK